MDEEKKRIEASYIGLRVTLVGAAATADPVMTRSDSNHGRDRRSGRDEVFPSAPLAPNSGSPGRP
jgi:hypothetical protein